MKAAKVKRGDTIALVSLSRGILGEPFVKHELDLGVKRLKDYGFKVKIMPNALKGLDYLEAHPEARADDLRAAFEDSEVKAIICAVGGEDTFRLAPYLFEDDSFKELVQKHPKIFMGFSDTTNNHFMLAKCGLNTFYGQAFLTELAELAPQMLPYSKACFESVFLKGDLKEIKSSPTWYMERTDYSEAALGTPRIEFSDHKGYELLTGPDFFEGPIFGGCIESMYDMLTGDRFSEEKEVISKYGLFPDDWAGKIILLETSEEKPESEKYGKMLNVLKAQGIFAKAAGVIVGKPQDEVYYEEYKEILKDTLAEYDLPIVYNINVGHGVPRAIIPFGIKARVEAENNRIVFLEDILNEE